MKNDRQPSHQDLKALYSAAIEFKKTAPWDWMHDSDIFGVGIKMVDSLPMLDGAKRIMGDFI